jgi:hypothetical protein
MEKELRVQMIHFHNLKKENKDFGFSIIMQKAGKHLKDVFFLEFSTNHYKGRVIIFDSVGFYKKK